MKKQKELWSEKEKDKIFNLFEYWIGMFGFQPMHLQVKFEDDDKNAEHGESAGCAMDIDYLYPYRSVRLKVYPYIKHSMDEESLERAMIHELMHMVLRELKEFREVPIDAYQKFEEKVCEQLAWFINRHCTKRFIK